MKKYEYDHTENGNGNGSKDVFVYITYDKDFDPKISTLERMATKYVRKNYPIHAIKNFGYLGSTTGKFTRKSWVKYQTVEYPF